MLGLNDYGSSDEEEAPVSQAPQQTHAPNSLPSQSTAPQARQNAQPRPPPPAPSQQPLAPNKPTPPPNDAPVPGPAQPSTTAPTLGPPPGPTPQPQDIPTRPIASTSHSPPPSTSAAASAPPSPHTTTRTQIHNLTLPPYPTFSIPPSPPGTPPPSTTAKFTKFLELKAQGTHFNARIAATPSLRNPGLLPKLLDFAGISQEESYASTLGEEEGGVMAVWPEEGYADSLQRSQSDIEKAREEEARRVGREKVEFVSAAGGGAAAVGVAGAGAGVSGPGTSNTGSRVSTPGSAAGSGATGRSGGVGREKGRVSAVRNGRGRWDEERRAGKRSRTGSRSPRR
ncbi:hypothetical protein H2201_007056 [Coniosporium apollinis]|uniref:HCNGP-like protein n=1 Tax=Coniosporium apollinis TaxID=61459 RepID=A0ABQ9NLY6_9PEZI|nr:hypothetical protein H2201_007056 [Coniosporium apollinis]